MRKTQAYAAVSRSFHFGFVPPLLSAAKGFNSAHAFLLYSLMTTTVSRNPGFCSQFQTSVTCAECDEKIGAKQTK